MQVFVSGKGGPEIPVHALNTGTLNISTVAPITTIPIVTAPTGDSTYLRKDGGNSPATGSIAFNAGLTRTTETSTGAGIHSGTETFTGNIIVSTLNGQSIVGGSLYPCTAAGHLAAIAALASTGGRVDATACTGAINFTATVNYGTVNRPIALLLGGVAITFTNTSGNGFQLNGRGCSLVGLGFLNTNILAGSGFTGDLIRVEPLSGSNSVDGVTVRGMRLDGNLAPGVKLLNMLSVREPSVVESLQLRTFTATALNVGKSAIGGAAISQNVSFSNVNLEPTVPATITADAATIACDGCNFNNNFTIVNGNNPIAAGFHAVTLTASASGDGRANTFMGGSLAGYDTELFATGVGAGTQGLRVIGTRFENFNTAITLTGPNGTFPTSHSFIGGNYYLVGIGTGAKYVNLDFAQSNTVIEDGAIGTGAVTLTANSLNNQVMVRVNNLADVSDSGTGNSVTETLNSGGVAQTNIIGQLRVFRDNTQADQWDFLDNNSLTGSATSGLIVGNKGITSTGVNAFPGSTVALTADWTCGTGGTVASCVAATIIGSGGGVPLTFTLPLIAQSYTLECDGVVGQATAATANQWNLLTATNGATNITANYTMNTAATAMAGGAVTDQASTTTTFQITPSWTLGGTATKMPFHIWAKIEGASASGTVVSLQLVAPTVADLVTIYRGAACRVF
jgi:hypothetical protein